MNVRALSMIVKEKSHGPVLYKYFLTSCNYLIDDNTLI